MSLLLKFFGIALNGYRVQLRKQASRALACWDLQWLWRRHKLLAASAAALQPHQISNRKNIVPQILKRKNWPESLRLLTWSSAMSLSTESWRRDGKCTCGWKPGSNSAAKFREWLLVKFSISLTFFLSAGSEEPNCHTFLYWVRVVSVG